MAYQQGTERLSFRHNSAVDQSNRPLFLKSLEAGHGPGRDALGTRWWLGEIVLLDDDCPELASFVKTANAIIDDKVSSRIARLGQFRPQEFVGESIVAHEAILTRLTRCIIGLAVAASHRVQLRQKGNQP